MIPRNNLVIIRPLPAEEVYVGKILVPANGECFREAIVEEVGPGNIASDGGRADTFDLHPGQRVMVKLFSHGRTQVGNTLVPDGIELRSPEGTMYLVAETSIVGIID